MARNTGKRPHEKLLEIMNVGTRLTPAEIDAHVGNGNYASKHVWFLGKLGFGFEVERQGRTVVAYTMTAEPANATEIRNPVAKTPKAKAPKVAKTPKVKAPVAPRVKAAATKVAKQKKAKSADLDAERMLQELNMNNACEVGGGSYSIDSDWDSMDGIDVANFLK
jgi:hypothetical protein